MAYITTQYCNKCEKELNFYNGKCPNCTERKRREEIAAWQALTVEEKLLDIHKRLLKLEAGPQTYA
jgi:predicted ATP-dependent serine protease